MENLKPSEFLMIPGPTPVPQDILEIISRHPIGHRSAEFSSILNTVSKNLKTLAQTESDVFILTGSGTLAMEAAIANTISSGTKVLSLVTGVFGERWVNIAKAYGAEVERLDSAPGSAVDIDQLTSKLKADKDKSIKVVTITHNETSTGVINDLRQIGHLVRQHGALAIVDAVTSFGAINIPMDEWHIDVMITGSQKALMLPPGLSMIFFGSRAWAAQATCKSPRFYLDLSRCKKSLDANTTPFTPNVSFICALKKSVELIQTEGIEKVQARHMKLKTMLRAGLRAMGLKLFVDDEFASPTITSILPPDKLSVANIRQALKQDYSIVVADGQDALKGKIFRIGHMGYVFERDILMTLASLQSVLKKLGQEASGQPAIKEALQAASKG
jgi:aspartate aminotransferase-like enzyme